MPPTPSEVYRVAEKGVGSYGGTVSGMNPMSEMPKSGRLAACQGYRNTTGSAATTSADKDTFNAFDLA